MRVASLHIHPVKALGGLSAGSVDVDRRGLSGDRRAMIVDAGGEFLTQREIPALATLRVEEGEGGGLVLSGPHGRVRVTRPRGGPRRTVSVWGDRVDAATGDPAVDDALSDWLGRRVFLVHMDAASRRPVDPAWEGEGAETSFADGFPLLLVGTASLEELNRRLAARGRPPVGMERFRPNLVVETHTPFAEDGWARIAVGDVEFDLVKPCARCVVTTTDQETGRVAEDNEPLATLVTFRRSRDRRVPGVLFGWNAIPRIMGGIHVGQEVEVLRTRDPWPVG